MNIHHFAEIADGISKTCLAIGAGTLLGLGGINLITTHLNAATAKQCANQAWPAHQHAEHVEFCQMYVIKAGSN